MTCTATQAHRLGHHGLCGNGFQPRGDHGLSSALHKVKSDRWTGLFMGRRTAPSLLTQPVPTAALFLRSCALPTWGSWGSLVLPVPLLVFCQFYLSVTGPSCEPLLRADPLEVFPENAGEEQAAAARPPLPYWTRQGQRELSKVGARHRARNSVLPGERQRLRVALHRARSRVLGRAGHGPAVLSWPRCATPHCPCITNVAIAASW